MPRPQVTLDTARFWEGCLEHRLLIQRCTRCDTHRMNPAPVCFVCGSFHWDWDESEGIGDVFTYTIVHHPVHPAMVESVPYVASVIQLRDCGQVKLTSNVIGCAPKLVHIGMTVRILWEDVADDCSLYRFGPS
jgi:uncharacterized protein